MARGAFLDTNILICAYTEHAHAETARFLAMEPYVISVQVLNEFANVGRRKLGLSWTNLDKILIKLADSAQLVLPLTLATHTAGRALAERYMLQLYDGVLLVSALEAGCEVLFSEDMQDGLVINGALAIRNPFAAS